MLMSGLRPLWETGRLPAASSGALQLSLLTREGGRAERELAVNPSALLAWLAARLQQGVREFYAALKTAFAVGMPRLAHRSARPGPRSGPGRIALCLACG